MWAGTPLTEVLRARTVRSYMPDRLYDCATAPLDQAFHIAPPWAAESDCLPPVDLAANDSTCVVTPGPTATALAPPVVGEGLDEVALDVGAGLAEPARSALTP